MIPTEPPLEATAAEVEQAYKQAFDELQKQENDIADCPTPERKRKKLALQRVQGITQRLLIRLTALQSSGELEKKITSVSRRQDEQAEELQEVKEIAVEAGEKAGAATEEVRRLADVVHFLEEGYEVMRRNLDEVDNKQRGHSVIAIGTTGVNERLAVEHLLQSKPDLLKDVEDVFPLGRGSGVPLHITFYTKSSSGKLIAWSHTQDFKSRFGKDVSVVRDRTELRRTGRSRLAAATPSLRTLDVAVHQFNDHAVVDGKKVDAIEFAASTVVIRESIFDIDAACAANQEYEVSEALFTRVGDVIVNGFRKKRRPAANGVGSGGSSSRQSASATSGSSATSSGSGRKRGLPQGQSVTAGGVNVMNGPNQRFHGNGNRLMMGSVADPYDVRYPLLSPPRHV